MKKIITIASLLALSLAANAQQETTVTTVTTTPVPVTRAYKPVAGNVLAEIGFFTGPNGIFGDVTSLSSSSFGTPQLKFRYFLANDLALRAGVNISQNTQTTRIYEGGAGSGEGYAKDRTSVVGINVGIEKHFSGTGRLSTYAGGDISFQKVGASTKWDNTANGTTYTDGASRKTTGFNANGDNGSFGFGLRGIAGADYYFVEKVYLGAELGWGFIASKESKTKDEVTLGGNTNTTETSSTGGEFNLAPSLSAGLRLGFIF